MLLFTPNKYINKDTPIHGNIYFKRTNVTKNLHLENMGILGVIPCLFLFCFVLFCVLFLFFNFRYIMQDTQTRMLCSVMRSILTHRSGPTLAQAMAFCLMTPNHHLNQCQVIIKGVLWH